VLARLGHLTGEVRYLDAAQRTVGAFHATLRRNPAGCASLALALAEQLAPPTLVVLRGPVDDMRVWQERLAALFMPEVMVVAIPERAGRLPPVLDKPVTARVNAWVCRGVECLSPLDDCAELVKLLGNSVLPR
jgi:hypothetical protein